MAKFLDTEGLTHIINDYLKPGFNDIYKSGAVKNKLKIISTTATINGITFTVNSDYSITVTGSISDSSTNAIFNLGDYTAEIGDLLCSGLDEANSKAYVYARSGSSSTATTNVRPIVNDIGINRIYAIAVLGTYTGTINLTFKPMICTEDAYRISKSYSPCILATTNDIDDVWNNSY